MIQKIEVRKFVNGNQGVTQSCGSIFRHGEIESILVPIASGCATPKMKNRSALVVKASGETRVIFPLYASGIDEPEFVLTLTSADRLPSGMQIPCEHCKSRGYVPQEG